MATPLPLLRPQRLEINAPYLLRESTASAPHSDFSSGVSYAPVTFVGYDSCPAFVFVRDAAGYVGRCPREDLFQQMSVVRLLRSPQT